ncbi:MAG: phosphatidylserine decarboxylase [Planctomycetota bacterium]|nr:phosphatidylserine decarboxylase [Planctomycetota bacterium]
MPLTRYGLREWMTITVVAVIAAVLLGWLLSSWLALVIGVLWLAVISFFRDPIRRVPVDLPAGSMLAPGDGVVTAVLRVDEHEATDGPAVIIRVFMSVLDVHVNRAPRDGEVVALRHTPGRFLNAQTEEAAAVNENNLIILAIDGDETIGVRQIAGLVARRIVCRLKEGDRVQRGEKFGMIKFGSTTELILPRPEAVTVHVAKGDRIKGGVTALATLAPNRASRQAAT